METLNIQEPALLGWNELGVQKKAVELYDNNEHVVKFTENTPKETSSKKFKGKTVYLFEVIENDELKTLIVTSLRLGVKLKQLAPLQGKVVSIRGFGRGTDRDYEVKEAGINLPAPTLELIRELN